MVNVLILNQLLKINSNDERYFTYYTFAYIKRWLQVWRTVQADNGTDKLEKQDKYNGSNKLFSRAT